MSITNVVIFSVLKVAFHNTFSLEEMRVDAHFVFSN